MEKDKLKKLFSGLCCSVCRHDFDEDAIFIKREEKNLLVLQVVCPECGKRLRGYEGLRFPYCKFCGQALER